MDAKQGEKVVTGNKDKYDSYSLAHRMIKESLENKCPLQAIAIEESILSDRLWAALHSKSAGARHRYENLGEALAVWKEKSKNGIRIIDLDEKCLFDQKAIAQWNEQRNKLIHGIVKYRTCECHITAARFITSAMKSAKEGLSLVRLAENWSKRAKRRVHNEKKKQA